MTLRIFTDKFVIAEYVANVNQAIAIAKPFSYNEVVCIVRSDMVCKSDEDKTVVWQVWKGVTTEKAKVEL